MCSVYVSVERSGNGAERAENKVSGSETVSADLPENARTGAERGAGARRAGAERRGSVTNIGLSVNGKSAAHAPLTCSVCDIFCYFSSLLQCNALCAVMQFKIPVSVILQRLTYTPSGCTV